MCMIFWDVRGIILEEYLLKGTSTTVTAARYCDTFSSLRMAIKSKRTGLLSPNVVFILDNARLHSAAITKSLLQSFRRNVLEQPPYSPDLASSDIHLYTKLKPALGDHHFQNDAQAEN